MIFFNGKGLLVAIVVALVFVFFGWIGQLANGVVLAGAAGLWASIKLSKKGEGFFSRPSVFFIPTHVYTTLILIVGIIGISSGAFKDEPADPRQSLLDIDIEILNTNAIDAEDSLTLLLKNYVTKRVFPQMQPENFHYLIKDNPKTNSTLTFVQSKEIEFIKDDYKSDLLPIVKNFVASYQFFKGKDNYIGIFEDNTLESCKNPSGEQTHSWLTNRSDFYDFYEASVQLKETE